MNQVQCTGVSKENLARVWARVAPLLIPALGEGEQIEHVTPRLAIGTAQLWIAADLRTIQAACVTEIATKGTRKYCNIWLAGGTGVNNWLPYLKNVEAWAKENGCDAMLIEKARSGWKRLLPDYKTKTITMTKEL